MPRWLSRLLWMIAQAAMIGGSPTWALAGGLYRCSAEDIRHLDKEGRLGTYIDSGPARGALGTFVIDTDTGSFRGPAGAAQWRIIQQGNESSDFVATPGLSERAAVTDYIRVRAWKLEASVTFFRVGLTTVTTGRCEAIR
ncbi:MAG: hypothetical protein MIL41_04780 [Hyphomicrobiales bacterium]|jgi:hypothetical protein